MMLDKCQGILINMDWHQLNPCETTQHTHTLTNTHTHAHTHIQLHTHTHTHNSKMLKSQCYINTISILSNSL